MLMLWVVDTMKSDSTLLYGRSEPEDSPAYKEYRKKVKVFITETFLQVGGGSERQFATFVANSSDETPWILRKNPDPHKSGHECALPSWKAALPNVPQDIWEPATEAHAKTLKKRTPPSTDQQDAASTLATLPHFAAKVTRSTTAKVSINIVTSRYVYINVIQIFFQFYNIYIYNNLYRTPPQ